ncbi:MAG: HAMP domain-containing sensor histidine kinase [Phycisphaerales bacterium]
MPDQSTSRLDAERLEARLSRLGEGLASIDGELEQLHRLATLGTAAGMIAHEVRGLLTPVRAYAQMALKSPDDRDLSKKALQKAEHGAASAVRISETILEIVGGLQTTTRAEELPAAGPTSVDVADAVHAVLDLMRPVLDEQGIEPAIEIEDGLAAAMGPVEFQQVLINLFENAARVMPHGGRLTVRGRCSTGNTRGPAGSDVVVEVEDTGPGVDGAIAERAMEPYVKGAASAPAAGVGAGLGLAVCRALVSHARGRISIGSAPGGGARVRVVLPAA